MRELLGHKVNPANDVLKVFVQDEPGDGGACHLYTIEGFDTKSNASNGGEPHYSVVELLFQNGPIGKVGVNGITHEALLAILIDRLEGFNAGKFATMENAEALCFLRGAQEKLQKRTRDRMERGVEGTHEK